MRTLGNHIVNTNLADEDNSCQHLGLTPPSGSQGVLSPFMTTMLSSVTYARPLLNAVCLPTNLDNQDGSANENVCVGISYSTVPLYNQTCYNKTYCVGSARLKNDHRLPQSGMSVSETRRHWSIALTRKSFGPHTCLESPIRTRSHWRPSRKYYSLASSPHYSNVFPTSGGLRKINVIVNRKYRPKN